MAAEDVDDEEQSHKHGNKREDRQRGQHRVDIGVLQAGEARNQILALRGQAVTIEPVRRSLDEQQECDEQRQLHLRRARCAIALRLQSKTAVEVLHNNCGDEEDQQQGEREAENEANERQREGVERQVETELRVSDTERCRVAPHQEGCPLPCSRKTAENAHHDRGDDRDDAAGRLDGESIALEACLLGGKAAEGGSRAVRPEQHETDRDTHEQAEAHEKANAGEQRGREDLGLIDGTEPQPVGVEPRENHEGDDDQAQHDDRGKQHPTAATRLWLGGIRTHAGAEIEAHLDNLRRDRAGGHLGPLAPRFQGCDGLVDGLDRGHGQPVRDVPGRLGAV